MKKKNSYYKQTNNRSSKYNNRSSSTNKQNNPKHSGLLLDNNPKEFPRLEQKRDWKTVKIEEMFDFKYKEDVENMFYSTIEIEQISNAEEEINIKSNDCLIDLSPCIELYCKACYFTNYDINKAINLEIMLKTNNKEIAKHLFSIEDQFKSIEKKILILTSITTEQNRYRNQVYVPFISCEDSKRIIERLSTEFSHNAPVQILHKIDIAGEFSAVGLLDTIKNDEIWLLKYTTDFSHEHFLQLASYLYEQKYKSGVIWNIRNNEKYRIKIKDTNKFYKLLVKTVTKGLLSVD